MIPIKDYIGSLFIGNTYHFMCECIVPIDTIGTVKDFEIYNNEVILLVDTNFKILHIGLNTPSLVVEEV